MDEQAKIPVSRVVLESAVGGRGAVVGLLAEADATLAAWSQGSVLDEAGTDADEAAMVYCVVSWADGSRLVASYDLASSAGVAPDLGAAIRAQCAYSAGLRRPSTMTAQEYEAFITGAGRATIAHYEEMLASLEM